MGLIKAPVNEPHWGQYHERAANHELKQRQRDRVADFLCSYRDKTDHVKLLSLPGEQWIFEHQLEKRLEETGQSLSVIGLEWSWRVMQRGHSWMIRGKSHDVSPEHFDWTAKTVTYLQGFIIPEHSCWVFAEASSFLGISLRNMNSETHRRRLRKLKRSTAAWLDFTSPLCEETIRSLNCLGSRLEKNKEIAPVAITLMAGRETGIQVGGGLSDRAKAVGLLLSVSQFRSAEVVDAWAHQRKGGAPMYTVLAELRLK